MHAKNVTTITDNSLATKNEKKDKKAYASRPRKKKIAEKKSAIEVQRIPTAAFMALLESVDRFIAVKQADALKRETELLTAQRLQDAFGHSVGLGTFTFEILQGNQS